MKRTIVLTTGFLVFATRALAQANEAAPTNGSGIWIALGHCAMFGAMGIALVIAGFKIFDWVITKIDLEKEIAGGNVASAILSAAAILGISIIVAAAIH